MLTESSFLEKGKIIAKLVGKYASTSVLATAVDFTTFYFALTYAGITEAVQSTIIGRLAGAGFAFSLHRRWVFQFVDTPQYKALMVKYVIGILLGLGLNVAGVWFLSDILNTEPVTARIIAAVAVWFLVFSYNNNVVFKKKIIADQDFAEVDDENTEGVAF